MVIRMIFTPYHIQPNHLEIFINSVSPNFNENSKGCIEMKSMGESTAEQWHTTETEMILYDDLAAADFHDFHFHDD